MRTLRNSPRTKTRSKSWVRVQGGPIVACIDMGTNSFHMIVCQASQERDHFDIITREKEAVPFFRRALTAHYIDDSALRSALRILRDMRNKAMHKGATTILAVATSAVRESKNGEEVLSRIRQELDIDARMISGHEEARLIYLGVLWSMPELKGTFAIVDIGGGSCELIVGDRKHTSFSESYKLGAARLTQRFFRKGTPTPDAIRELHDEVRGVLRPAAARILASGALSQLIGTSGTVLAIARLNRDRHDKSHAELHGYKLSVSAVESTVIYLEEASLKGVRVEGISSDRNQTILAGSIVLLETMRSLSATEIVICTAALREGVVVDRFLQTNWLNSGLETHRDPRSDSVHALLEKYHASVEHAEQVARLATEIFLQSHGSLHSYSESAGHLLWSAAMLHDVGTFIGRNGHHKHSYYLIKNGGLLGHSEEEVGLIASIARYHRGSELKDSHEAVSLLTPDERELVTDMAAILRLAEALDRSHRQVVQELKLIVGAQPKGRYENRSLTLYVSLREAENCQPESWAFHEKKALFEQRFASQITLKVAEGRGQIQGLLAGLPSHSELK